MDQKQKRKEYIKSWKKQNPEAVKAIAQRWRNKNMESIRSKRRIKNYGLTEEEFQTMKLAQNNCCAICRIERNDKRRPELDIDHCHVSDKVRGLLCNNCNRGLGHFQDSIEFLENAVNYLKEFNARL